MCQVSIQQALPDGLCNRERNAVIPAEWTRWLSGQSALLGSWKAHNVQEKNRRIRLEGICRGSLATLSEKVLTSKLCLTEIYSCKF